MASNPYVHMIVPLNTAGLISYRNDGAARLFGDSAAEADGQSLDLIVPWDYRERHWVGFRKAMRTSECTLDRTAINLPVLRKDGTVRVFPARFVFLQDARNQVGGALGIFSTPEGSGQPIGPIIGV